MPGTTGFGYDGTVISNPEWKKGTYEYRIQYAFLTALVDYVVREENITKKSLTRDGEWVRLGK